MLFSLFGAFPSVKHNVVRLTTKDNVCQHTILLYFMGKIINQQHHLIALSILVIVKAIIEAPSFLMRTVSLQMLLIMITTTQNTRYQNTKYEV